MFPAITSLKDKIISKARVILSIVKEDVSAAIAALDHPHLHEHRAFLALFAINTAVFVAECVSPGLLATYALKSQDWGTLAGLAEIVTSMFTHANFSRYFYNMLIVAPFAVYLERRIGSKEFLIFWLLCGVGAAVGFAYTPRLMEAWACIGASGACFGVIAGACWLVDEHPVARMLALFVLTAMVWPNYAMTIVGFLLPVGIASAGHLCGAATGLVLVNELKKSKKA